MSSDSVSFLGAPNEKPKEFDFSFLGISSVPRPLSFFAGRAFFAGSSVPRPLSFFAGPAFCTGAELPKNEKEGVGAGGGGVAAGFAFGFGLPNMENAGLALAGAGAGAGAASLAFGLGLPNMENAGCFTGAGAGADFGAGLDFCAGDPNMLNAGFAALAGAGAGLGAGLGAALLPPKIEENASVTGSETSTDLIGFGLEAATGFFAAGFSSFAGPPNTEPRLSVGDGFFVFLGSGAFRIDPISIFGASFFLGAGAGALNTEPRSNFLGGGFFSGSGALKMEPRSSAGFTSSFFSLAAARAICGNKGYSHQSRGIGLNRNWNYETKHLPWAAFLAWAATYFRESRSDGDVHKRTVRLELDPR